ncbi:GDP-mannose 4,6-dehydratase [Caloramator sp. mosi_1]|nr:GDP-mannose 4,6-dehydratase [Caloramator sp. mosi_1]WDC83285.1 GDP-mannose 4,6-dehydratase [Caloramator sp. mosi_1]
MKTVLVTGATGYVGSNLVKTLVNLGYNVHIVVRKESKLEVLESF